LRPLVGVCALRFLQCSDTIGWVPLIPADSDLEQVMEKPRGNWQTRIHPEYDNYSRDWYTCYVLLIKGGCVYIFQFVKGQRWPELTLRLVQSLSLGQKDAHRTLFSVWQHIFAMPRAKRYGLAVCDLLSLCDGGCSKAVFALWNIAQLWARLCGCGYRKRYVNPYDRVDSVQLAEELKQMNEENNLSLSSRSAMYLYFCYGLL